MPNARKLILKNHLSPGDVICMTAAVHSLHRRHPGKFVTAVDTTASELWEHNPDVTPIPPEGREWFELHEMHYELINQSNQRAVHVLQGYCDHLAGFLGVDVPLLTNRPLLFLSEQEKSWLNQVQEMTGHAQKFWLVNAGRKSCFTAKFWGTDNYQRVVDLLRGKVLFVQIGSAEHYHPPLRGVVNLVGKTTIRQLVRLAWHAQGGLCGVTFLHHLMAALEKPCVTLLGGREPVQWNSYPRCQLLHTVGSLPCCASGGCWKSRTVKLNDGAEQDGSVCDQPMPGPDPIPRCMALLPPERVAEAILLSYEGGVLTC